MWVVKRSRHKILGYLFVLVPLVLTLFSSFSEPLKSWFIGQYQLRWYVEEIDPERKLLITVSNNGNVPVSRARLHFQIESNKPRPLADISFGRADGTPMVSFFSHLITVDPPVAEPKSGEQLMAVYDRHSTTRTLFDVEKVFDQMVSANLKAKEPLLKLVAEMENGNVNYDDWHQGWLAQCAARGISAPNCQLGYNLLATWEKSKRDLLLKAQKGWYDATGVVLLHKNDQLSPGGEVDLTFDVGANESAVLEIQYNTDPSMEIHPVITFTSSSITQTTRVTDKAYLTAFLPSFMFKYYFWTFACIVGIGAFMIWFAWPAILPKRLLRISHIFRIAIDEQDHEYWDHGLERHRFHILQQFRDTRARFNKQHVDLDNDEVLDYVRSALVKAYKNDKTKLANDRKLNLIIHSAIKMFLAAAP